MTEGCGALVAPEPRAVAAALCELLDDPARRRAAAEAGPARARALCDLEPRMRELGEALARLAEPVLPRGDRGLAPRLTEERVALRAIGEALQGRARLEDAVELRAPGESTRVESASAPLVIASATLDRVDNPRALVREMARVARPGGWIAVATSNNLSLKNKASLVARDRFAGDGALVEGDLLGMARDCGLVAAEVGYAPARAPLGLGSEGWLARRRARWFGSTAVLLARRP